MRITLEKPNPSQVCIEDDKEREVVIIDYFMDSVDPEGVCRVSIKPPKKPVASDWEVLDVGRISYGLDVRIAVTVVVGTKLVSERARIRPPIVMHHKVLMRHD